MWTSSRHFKFNLPKIKLLTPFPQILKLLHSPVFHYRNIQISLLSLTFKIYPALHRSHFMPRHRHLFAELEQLPHGCSCCFDSYVSVVNFPYSNQIKHFKLWHSQKRHPTPSTVATWVCWQDKVFVATLLIWMDCQPKFGSQTLRLMAPRTHTKRVQKDLLPI